MSVRIPAVALALGVSACAPPPAANPPPAAELVQACAGNDGWTDPAPPARLAGGVYLVGTCGITVVLVASPRGHVLIDSGPAEAAPLVLANIRRLGFDPRGVKWLLASHAHFDHVGGLAALKAATGARVAALPDQARELASGATPADDPQFGAIAGFAAVMVDRVLADGTTLEVGPIRIAGHATPGHTRGSTSWVIRDCPRADCVAVTYADSTSAVSAESYRFADHADWVARFRGGVGRIGALPCDILVTPHPAASNLFARLAGDAPLRDSNQCARYAAGAIDRLDRRLAKERAAP